MRLAAPAPRRTVVSLALALGVAAAGCDGVLDPRSEQADSVARLAWFVLVLGFGIAGSVGLLLLVAIVIGRRRAAPSDVTTGLKGMIAVGGVGLPIVVIVTLSIWSLVVDRAALADDGSEDALVIEVVGYRYWWEVRYPAHGVVTANEIHVPVGQRVRLDLTADDVIHSFWVPQLGGKADLIPGLQNQLDVQATEAGRYRGQCAEFCGLQHAQMRIVVVAMASDEFDDWLTAQAAPASVATNDDLFALGRDVFRSAGCVSCHTVRGHESGGRVGPDLTHLQSRETIVAGMLPNSRGNLAGWILEAQTLKPGSLMPSTELTPDQLDALLHYLGELE